MGGDGVIPRLSRITTIWTVLNQAHAGSSDASAAQQQLLERYGGAIHRCLSRILRDPHAVEELTQEFALCLVRGDFHKVCPERGRFRDYVKTVLAHLVCRHHTRRQALPQTLAPESPTLANLPAPASDADREFRERWREEILTRTWEALAVQQGSYYTVLRLRAQQPELSSQQMAEQLQREHGKPFSAESVRQTLHRARTRFAELLVEEVAHSLQAPTHAEIEDELRELDLFVYCQETVERLQREGQ